MTEGRAPTWATFSERGDRRPPPPARLPSGASFGERGDPRPLPPNRLGSTASTFSERAGSTASWSRCCQGLRYLQAGDAPAQASRAAKAAHES